MFQFQKAGASFEKAYSFRKSEDILKRMYYLSRTGEGMTDRKHHLPPVNEAQREAWEKDIGEARERAKTSESILKLEGLFEKDSAEKLEGASKLIRQWKQEYRGMV